MYLVLPANVDSSEFPENSNTAYKVRLANRLRLDGTQWECALVDCFYTNNWHNLTESSMTIRRMVTDGSSQTDAYRMITLKIPDGRYESLRAVTQKIAEILRVTKLSDAISIYYLEERDVLRLVLADEHHAVSFSPELGAVLGFTSGGYYQRCEGSQYAESTISPDVNQGFTSLYVYCSLCENRLVGDTTVRLLRVLPVRSGKKNRNIYEEVGQKLYVPVANTDSDVVEVNINRDDGSPVAFKGGKVIVTVHLRRVR